MLRKKMDNEGSASSAAIIVGIILIIGSLILPLILNVIFGVDTAESAWSKVKGQTVSAGTDVKFKGTVKSVTQDSDYTGLGMMYVNGFSAPIFFRSGQSFAPGDKVTVKGKYYGAVGYGGVAGSWGWYGAPEPASVEKGWPWEFGELCTIVLILGIILVIVGIVYACVGAAKRRTPTGETPYYPRQYRPNIASHKKLPRIISGNGPASASKSKKPPRIISR